MGNGGPTPWPPVGPWVLDRAEVRGELERRGLDLPAIEKAIEDAHRRPLFTMMARGLEGREKRFEKARERILRPGSDVRLFAESDRCANWPPQLQAKAFVEALRGWFPWRGREPSTGDGRPRELWKRTLETRLRSLKVQRDEIRDIVAAIRKHVSHVESRLLDHPRQHVRRRSRRVGK